ncbi:unnamed protein product, partial [Hapterophycus canaliculatus]
VSRFGAHTAFYISACMGMAWLAGWICTGSDAPVDVGKGAGFNCTAAPAAQQLEEEEEGGGEEEEEEEEEKESGRGALVLEATPTAGSKKGVASTPKRDFWAAAGMGRVPGAWKFHNPAMVARAPKAVDSDPCASQNPGRCGCTMPIQSQGYFLDQSPGCSDWSERIFTVGGFRRSSSSQSRAPLHPPECCARTRARVPKLPLDGRHRGTYSSSEPDSTPSPPAVTSLALPPPTAAAAIVTAGAAAGRLGPPAGREETKAEQPPFGSTIVTARCATTGAAEGTDGIGRGKPGKIGPQRGDETRLLAFPWRAMGASPAAWGCVAGNVGAGVAINVVMSWLPTYYEDFILVHLEDIHTAALLSPNLTMMLFSILGGVAYSWLTNTRGFSRALASRVISGAAFAISVVVFPCFALARSSATATLLSSLALASSALSRGGWSTKHMEIAANPDHAAMLYSVANTISAAASVVGISATGTLLDTHGGGGAPRAWAVAMGAVGGACGVCGIAFVCCARGDTILFPLAGTGTAAAVPVTARETKERSEGEPAPAWGTWKWWRWRNKEPATLSSWPQPFGWTADMSPA